MRHTADDRTAGAPVLPEWILGRDRRRPLVYVTLGTIFNRTQGVLERLVEGAGRLDADVLVTTGEDGTAPTRVPDKLVVERYVPQGDLYTHLAAVVCHGGFGTVFGSIGHEKACAPISADQVVNAALVEQLVATGEPVVRR